MTAWTEIPDADIEPDQPIKSSTAFALRDNLLAVLEGATGAPSVTARIITPGGSQADGACINATSFPGPGFFDFSTLTLTAPKTMPFASFIRVDGDATISDVLTVRRTLASAAAEERLIQAFGGAAAGTSADQAGSSISTGGGGGVVGDGGDANSGASPDGGDGILGASASTLVRSWIARRVLIGGNSGTTDSTSGVVGGGFIFIIVNGNLNATGGTIDASGVNGNASGSDANGGGGGGAIIIVCTGTITGGTYDASGGDGGNSTADGGGGGGGLVLLVATAFAGTRTKTVTGGVGPGSAVDGDAGLSLESTLTAGQINALLLGAH